MLVQHRPHQVTGTGETCCKVAELPQKLQPAQAGASAESAWLMATDAPLQEFRVRSSAPGLRGQTMAPVPHKIAHSCILNEAWGQMVWNDIIQFSDKGRAEPAQQYRPCLRGEGRMLPECHAHICCASFSNSSKIVLAADTSWAFSPYVDELEGSGVWGGRVRSYVNFVMWIFHLFAFVQ